ncbi:MAG TPA: family 1 glycosylhydrolase, partial [Spirochaetia bacterium]|nr:family 1 glycosylhydrolase [Spirochaetia bacterium]
MRIVFPPGFRWGVATASYQIEGSPLADGAGPSIWHEFSHRPGRIKDGTNGDLACDHYHLYAQDVGLMKDLGLGAYRFSVSWPRIFPEPHRPNQKGIDFYSRLVDCLLAAGIEPWLTIFHWDEPIWLEKMGGFRKRLAIDHLVEYGSCLFRSLGDRVKNWVSVNEPSIFTSLGYILGLFPPGRKNDLSGMFRCAHHLLLAHARLRASMRNLVPDGRMGMAFAQIWISPRAADNEKDRRAAEFMDHTLNRFFIDPFFFGTYPARVLAKIGRRLPRGFDRDLPDMKGSMDFAGINYYQRSVYQWAPFQPYTHAKEYVDPTAPRSAMWEIYPAGIYKLLLRMRDEYDNLPCYITENGFPLPTTDERDPLDDPERIAYLRDHIALVGKAIDEGVDCRGYFAWTLMDNFEWAFGHL